MIRIEDFTDEKQKPLFPQPASVNAFLTNEFDTQSLLDLFLSCTYDFTNTPQAIIHQAFSSYLQHQVLTDGFATQDAIKESLSGSDLHLSTSIMF